MGGGIEKLEENFNMYLRVKLDGFMRVYQEFYLADFKERFFQSDSGTEKLALLQDETAAKGIPLYLIIDEYDNFTNTVLNEQGRMYIGQSPMPTASTVMSSRSSRVCLNVFSSQVSVLLPWTM